MAELSGYTWIVVLATFVSCAMAFGIGANDVANAFGTSVGAGTISLKQAIVLATILETLGAAIMGQHVTSTISSSIVQKGLFKNYPLVLMWGMFCSLIGASLWVNLATYFGMAVSTTHSIVGAIIGFTVCARGFDAVNWWGGLDKGVIRIFMSWVISPLMSFVLGCILFFLVRLIILRAKNSVIRAIWSLPFFYFISTATVVFFIVYKGSPRLNLDDMEVGEALAIGFGIGAGVGLLALAIVVPLAFRKLKMMNETIAAKEQADLEAAKASENGGAEGEAVVEGAQVEKKESVLTKMAGLIKEIEFDEETKAMHARAEKFDERAEEMYKLLQVFTACALAFAHGSNDVANAVGPLAAIYTIYETGTVPSQSEIYWWQLLMGGLFISLGFAVWGYKLVVNLGGKLTYMTPSRGFCSEITSSGTVILASRLGLPISTTQVDVGSTLGVGAVDNYKNVNWYLFLQFFASWVMTIIFASLVTAGLFAATVWIVGGFYATT